jgi:hypothetical protein
VIVLAVGLLGYVGLSSVADRDWHAAVTIDGAAIGRADVRNRGAVLEALSVARARALTDLWLAGGVSAIEREALAAGLGLADPLTATVDDLVRERAIRDEAVAAGIAAPAVDPWAELAAAAVQPVARHIRWVVITGPAGATPDGTPAEGWPIAPTGGPTSPEALAARDAAARKAAGLLPTAPAADVVAAAVSAGWTIRGEDAWIADRGPVAGIPDVLVAALRDPALVDGAAVGPIADEASAGLGIGVLRGHGLPPDVDKARESVASLGIDEAWLRPWAEARVLGRRLEAAKVAGWTATPSRIVSAREVIVSSAAVSGGAGPYAGLAHLVIAELPADLLPPAEPHPHFAGGTPADVLAGRPCPRGGVGRRARRGGSRAATPRVEVDPAERLWHGVRARRMVGDGCRTGDRWARALGGVRWAF